MSAQYFLRESRAKSDLSFSRLVGRFRSWVGRIVQGLLGGGVAVGTFRIIGSGQEWYLWKIGR